MTKSRKIPSKLGSNKSKNLIIAHIPIKFWFHRLDIEKLWRILDPRINFCFGNIPKFKLNLKERISEQNDKMEQSTIFEAFLIEIRPLWAVAVAQHNRKVSKETVVFLWNYLLAAWWLEQQSSSGRFLCLSGTLLFSSYSLQTSLKTPLGFCFQGSIMEKTLWRWKRNHLLLF